MDYLERIERQLELPPAEKAEVMKELRSHYEEIVAELVHSGTERRQAEQEAAGRLGSPSEIAAQMRTVHGKASWKVTALVALPFLLSIIAQLLRTHPHAGRGATPPATILFFLLATALLVGGSLRELRHGWRPLWLATWLPASVWFFGIPIGLIERLLMRQEAGALPSALLVFNTALSILVYLSAGVWAAWPKRRLLALVVASQVCSWVPLLFVLPYPGRILPSWMVLPPMALVSVTWVVVALRLFEPRRPGGFTTASLALFTMVGLGVATQRFGRSPVELLQREYVVLFLPVLAVVTFARLTSWRFKVLTLAVAIAVPGLWPLLTSSMDTSDAVYELSRMLLELAVVVGVPLVFELKARPRTPARA